MYRSVNGINKTGIHCNTNGNKDELDIGHDNILYGCNSTQEKFKDTTVTIRICKSKKYRQHNGQTKKDKRTNNDLQNMKQKTKDRVTRTPLKNRVIRMGKSKKNIQ